MLRRGVVANAGLRPTGFKILLEILIEGEYGSVAEAPYTFRARSSGESKLSTGQRIDYLKHIYSLMRRKGELGRFARFCLVGLSGAVVNIGLLWSLTEFAGLFYLVSAAIGIEASIVSNFTLNNYFTFADRGTPGTRSFISRLLKFNMVSLAGLAVSMGVIGLFTEVLGLYYLLSSLFGIVVATLWNYLASNWWTWR